MDPPPLKKYAVLLFDGFQALDVFGPLDILNMLSHDRALELAVMAARPGPVSTRTPAMPHRVGERVVPTHTLADAPADTEVLLVPGGLGVRAAAFPRLRFLLTVCTGSALAARAGVLDGRRATTNKAEFDWVAALDPRVDWVRRARWVVDGNVWTSSGVSAGIDMMYAFVAAQYGDGVAADLAREAEYVRNTDPGNDPFAGCACHHCQTGEESCRSSAAPRPAPRRQLSSGQPRQ